MKHIVLSDIHENFHNLNLVIHYAKNHGIESGFVLGDLINPGIMHQLGKSGIKLRIVLGNNDGDVFNLTNTTRKYENLELLGEYGTVKLDDKNIFLIHDNILGELIARSETFDVVMCGHNHIFNVMKIKSSKLLNPGEVSGHMHGKCTFAVWNDNTNEITKIEITKGWMNVKGFKKTDKCEFEYAETLCI